MAWRRRTSTPLEEFVEHGEEGDDILATCDVEVLEVGRANPEVVADAFAACEDFGVVVFVGDVFYHDWVVFRWVKFACGVGSWRVVAGLPTGT